MVGRYSPSSAVRSIGGADFTGAAAFADGTFVPAALMDSGFVPTAVLADSAAVIAAAFTTAGDLPDGCLAGSRVATFFPAAAGREAIAESGADFTGPASGSFGTGCMTIERGSCAIAGPVMLRGPFVEAAIVCFIRAVAGGSLAVARGCFAVAGDSSLAVATGTGDLGAAAAVCTVILGTAGAGRF